MSYAKLFGTITDSSLWSASKDARILFVSMLARADATGFVEAALPGLARMANLTLAEAESALAVLMSPDSYSKSTDHDGRRVVAVPRGWCLVTYMEYRERRDEEERREYMRDYMTQYRSNPVNRKSLHVNKNSLPLTPVNNCKPCKPPLAKAEAEAEAEAEEKTEYKTTCPADAELVGPSFAVVKGEVRIGRKFYATLAEAYPTADIDGELAKAAAWCASATKKKTAGGIKRFINGWLNRNHRPVERSSTGPFIPSLTPDQIAYALEIESEAKSHA